MLQEILLIIMQKETIDQIEMNILKEIININKEITTTIIIDIKITTNKEMVLDKIIDIIIQTMVIITIIETTKTKIMKTETIILETITSTRVLDH